MTLFFEIFFSFPVIIFSFLLSISVLYWLVAALGIFDIDCLDIDINSADGIDITVSGFGGLLMKFGLNNVPMTLIITLISLFGWFISYFIFYFILQFMQSSFLYYVFGVIIFVVAFIVSVYMTAITIKPLRPLFHKINQTVQAENLIGKVVEIRSSVVTAKKGQAIYEDGGAGLILDVRCMQQSTLKRGDCAVIIRYDKALFIYEIISQEAFLGQ